MDGDFYFPVYSRSKNMKPQKIQTYALYKKLSENLKSNDNLVIAVDDTNEIVVSFNGRSDCKVFPFDKVLCSDESQKELYDSLTKSITQDITAGLNCSIIVCNLASSNTSRFFQSNSPYFELDSVQLLIQNILRELFSYMRQGENVDSSLHASFFEIHENRIIDHFSNCNELKDLQISRIPEQNYTEIKDLVEIPIADEKDAVELIKQYHNLLCSSKLCFSILTLSLVRKYISCDGFELIKVGKLRVVDFVKCRNNVLEAGIFEDCLLKTSQNSESNTRNEILDILRSVFGSNSKILMIVTLSPTLYSAEKDLSVLQFVSQAQKISCFPEADAKLIIPSSLKEYSEEIQELQKDFNAISKSTGIELKIPLYRYFKNSLSLENEKVKLLYSYLVSLTDSINKKKQNLIAIHANAELEENEIKEVKEKCKPLKLDLDKMKEENNIKQISSIKAEQIITMKEMKNVNELNIKKLKLESTKTRRSYEELMHSFESLKCDMVSSSSDIDAEHVSLKNTLNLLMADMNKALSECRTLHEDLNIKINDLSDIDSFIKSVKQNSEILISKFSSFIEEYDRSFDTIQFKIKSSKPVNISSTEILEIIRNSRNEKWPVLCYYFQKVQVFCDTSFKILSEIVCQIDIMQNYYKTELKTLDTTICSFSKVLKKFVSDISIALKKSHQHFEEQEKNLVLLTEFVHFHHKFKKNFDNSFTDLKNSLLTLKQMCISHNDAAINKWNEIKRGCLKNSQNHAELKENLFLIHKQMSSYMNDLAQQKLNALGCQQLKDKTVNVESRTQQLLYIYSEMKGVTETAIEINLKSADKESQEIKEYLNSQKSDVERYFDNYFLEIKINSSSFFGSLKNIQHLFINNKEDFKRSLDFLSTVLSSLFSVYNNYQFLSSNLLEQSERGLRFPSSVIIETNDNMPELESIYLDEWKVSSSTPNVVEKKVFNVAYEKEKMLSRIRSVVEHQISQTISEKLNVGDLDLDGKDRRNHNTTTVSLPNLSTNQSTQSKSYQMMGKNLSKIKLAKRKN